jgi:hypothetical protein
MSAPKALARPLCWLIGHRWVRLRTNLTKAIWLAHLSPIAGEDLDCARCGHQWRDFYGFGITPENAHLCRVNPPEDWNYDVRASLASEGKG